ncbi:hypothetical protein [Methanothrix thermoacetophila]|nr:hypothetical protein [Methanothrix thermoacetophila]
MIRGPQGVQALGFHQLTTVRSARWMHAASASIRRDSSLPHGSPARAGVRMRLQGLAFQAIEHARGGGEEVVMVAGRRGWRENQTIDPCLI